MTVADVIILLVVIAILFLIIFFNFYVPKKKGIPSECSYCPASKRAKKLLKKYKKSKSKNK